MNRPDFSPAMLKSFLRIRVAWRDMTSFKPGFDTQKAERAALMRAAGVSRDEFNRAWRGWSLPVAARLGLWAALGIVPGDCGVMLTDEGQEMALPTPEVRR